MSGIRIVPSRRIGASPHCKERVLDAQELDLSRYVLVTQAGFFNGEITHICDMLGKTWGAKNFCFVRTNGKKGSVEHYAIFPSMSRELLLARRFGNQEFLKKHQYNLIAGAYAQDNGSACRLMALFESALSIGLRDPQSALVSEFEGAEQILRGYLTRGMGGAVNLLRGR